MPNAINPAFRDRLILVEEDQVGPINRLSNMGSDHPMLRPDWQTTDPIRGVLGRYRVVYTSSVGVAPWNYAGALNNLPTLTTTNQGAYSNASSPDYRGYLYSQLEGPNSNTNIVFDYNMSTDASGEKYLNLVHGNVERQTWNGYSNRAEATRDYLDNPSNMFSVVDGWVTTTGNDWLVDSACGFSLASANKKIRTAAGYNLDVEPVYNYYTSTTPSYEVVVGYGATEANPAPVNPQIKEYHLPNIYFLQSELNNTSSVPLALYHLPALTLNQTIPWFEIGDTHTVGALTATENDGNRYYDMYAEGLQAMLGDDTLYQQVDASLQNNNRNFVVLHSDLGAVKEDSINQTTIPFYNKITLGTDPGNSTGNNADISILRALSTDPDTRDFIDILQMETVLRHQAMETSTAPWPDVTYMASQKTVDSAVSPTFTWSSTAASYKVLYDFDGLFQDFEDTDLEVNIAEMLNAFISPDPVNYTPDLETQPYRLIRDYKQSTAQLMVDPASVFAAEVDMFESTGSSARLSHVVRSFEEVLHGTAAHTETLMYVVHKKTTPSGPPVQTFYISPEFTTDVATVYFDTQVKYETNYYYEVDKIVLVFGTQYKYAQVEPINATAENENRARIRMETAPMVRALVVPYTSGDEGMKSIIIDKPPVPPEISFYPYKGINNKLKILLNSNTGEQRSVPVVMVPGDQEYFLQEYRAQTGDFDLDYEEFIVQGTKLNFRSDDPVDAYQVFRLASPPMSYEDFGDQPILVDPERGIPGSFEDTILPNTKYYYCARAIDFHGNRSNPTHVYEIEIVDNNGQIFIKQRVFTYEPPKEQFIKAGRRFIYIEPTMMQTLLQSSVDVGIPAVTSEPNSSILGAEGVDPVWGKEFKVRLTSKKTGRKVDLNLTFKNSGIVNASE